MDLRTNATEPFFTPEVGSDKGSLFKFFINDFPKLLEEKTDSVTLDNTKIPCLLFADDLVLFSNTKEGLQSKLDILNDYCEEWCLGINPKKTKVLIFNKSGKLIKYNFHIVRKTINI
jgi:hypothetical protein